MPFVKLDCAILNSTLWFERDVREIFITALLMAEPMEFSEPIPEVKTRSLDYSGWSAPPGWYGFVAAAGSGIIRRACVEDLEAGMDALEKLASPEASSRSQDFEGRRMIRISGGFLVLNFMKYREKDHGAAERMRRLRARRKMAESDVTLQPNIATLPRNVTQAEDRGQSTETDSDQIQEPVLATLVPPTTKNGNRKVRKPFTPPTVEEVREFIEKGNVQNVEAMEFCSFWAMSDWYRKPGLRLTNWRAAVRNLEARRSHQ